MPHVAGNQCSVQRHSWLRYEDHQRRGCRYLLSGTFSKLHLYSPFADPAWIAPCSPWVWKNISFAINLANQVRMVVFAYVIDHKHKIYEFTCKAYFLSQIWLRFWQGLGARILWIGLGGSIFFGALEKTKDFMEERSLSKAVTTSGGYVW
jgi:hypothetical protein